jgi:hypothetical protein
MNKVFGIRKLFELFMVGFLAVLTGYLFTILYLLVMWKYGDPRWGLPFLWFIPHGIKGLHFHHDIEFFIITPVMVYLVRKGKVSKEVAFIVCAFYLGMALHHWNTEGLRLVTIE